MGLLDSVRKNRGHASDILAKAVQNSTVKKQDDSLYYPERDSTGSASVIIRFLPQKNTDAVPFISKYNHIFKLKNSNKWLWEACPTTVGKDCPFCERNSKLFTSGNSNMVQVARERKRKKEYYANILVIKDGSAYMEEASCKDHICMNMGHISQVGETIICLPNEVFVKVINKDGEGGDYDAILQ